MRHYENLVVIKATLTNEEIESQVEALKQTIVDNGGEIVAKGNFKDFIKQNSLTANYIGRKMKIE